MIFRIARIRAAEIVAAAVFAVAVGPACAQTFVFHLSGDQEVPPTVSTARGGCHGELDQGAANFVLHCSHDVVGATLMHIQRAPPGANGPIVFDLGDPASPVMATWTGMTPTDIADLLAGELYVNVKTAGRPEGEIRGQILERTFDTLAFVLDGDQQVPPVETQASGNCVADLDDTATTVAIDCTHDVAAPTGAHIHNAPFGAVGPTVFTFASAANPISDVASLTPAEVAELVAGFFYVDVHSVEATDGEIRGQIAVLPLGTGPEVVATKDSGTTTVPETGATVTYTFTVANPGTAAFTINSLEDTPFGTLAGDADCQVGTVIAAGTSCDFDAGFDVPAGGTGETFVNSFEVTVGDDDLITASDSDEHTVTYTGVAPVVAVAKDSATTEVLADGAMVTYSFAVQNTGTVAFTITALDDTPFGALAGDADCQVGTALQPGATCSFDATFDVPPGAAGTSFVNTFTAMVSDADSVTASDSDEHAVTYTSVAPVVAVAKDSASTEVLADGAMVTYSFEVQNTGTVAFTITALDDTPFGALAGDADCQVGTALQPGATCSFDATFDVPPGAAGTSFVNTFTAMVSNADSVTAGDSDGHTVTYVSGALPPVPSARVIPSGSRYGLVLLMLAIVGAGWVMLRRSG